MKHRISFVIILITLLVSCSPVSTFTPTKIPLPSATFTAISTPSANEKLLRSLVYYDGCNSACWIGIEVGKTSFDQAQKILVDRYTTSKLFMPLDNIMIWLPSEVDSSHGTISFSQGIVDGVQLFIENSKFIASDAIKVFGEPSDVMISIDPTKPRKCGGVQLSYSETGTVVYIDPTQTFKGVEKSQSVTGFWFRSPEDLQSMQSNIQNDGISMEVKWQGYKDYCETIPITPNPATTSTPTETLSAPVTFATVTPSNNTLSERENVEREIISFMLDSILQGENGEPANYIRTVGQPWLNPPPSATLIVYAPSNEQKEKNPWEQLDTDKPNKVWWYFDNNLIEATEKEIAIQKYVERYEYNSHDWSSYEFGILSISSDNKTATVYSASSFCPECAGGSILTLEKSDSGKWIIIDSELLWLS